MSKFSSDRAEELYDLSLNGGADEECGSVCEAPCVWYGLMREERAILTEDSQGFVDVAEYDTAEELDAAWADCLADTELPDEDEDAEPSEEDYIISDARNGGYSVGIVGGRHVGDYDTRDEAEDAIRAHAGGSFFPNVWVQSDHGNNHLIENFRWE